MPAVQHASPAVRQVLYAQHLAAKTKPIDPCGFEPDFSDFEDVLDPHQRDVLNFGCRLGIFGCFHERGLGKTLVEMLFCRAAARASGDPALIVAPLAVAIQIESLEGPKFGLEINRVRKPEEIQAGVINVTHYAMFYRWEWCPKLSALVYDESQILRDYSGAMRKKLTRHMLEWSQYRMLATATAMPNNLIDIGNQSAALGVLESRKMLARYFVADQKQMGKQTLKKKGERAFFEWVASWASVLTLPSDLGYDDTDFILPPLTEHVHVVPVDARDGLAADAKAGTQGSLIRAGKLSIQAMHNEARLTSFDRCVRACEIIAEKPEENWVIWSDTNYDCDQMLEIDSSIVDLRGGMADSRKEEIILSMSRGEIPRLMTKMSMCGYGVNWQHVADSICLAPSYSWESRYQGVGRFHRRGQLRPVSFHTVMAETQEVIYRKMKVKGAEDRRFKRRAVEISAAVVRGETLREVIDMESQTGHNWEAFLGDGVTYSLAWLSTMMPPMPDLPPELQGTPSALLAANGGMVDFGIHSPPFGEELYIYNDSPNDHGNCETREEFLSGYRFMVDALYDLCRPGRIHCVHIKDTAAYINKHGYSGVQRLSADIRDAWVKQFWECTDCGFGYYVSRTSPAYSKCLKCQGGNTRVTGGRWREVSPAITIWTDPVREQQKTKNHRLLHKTAAADSSFLRVGIPEYVQVYQRWPTDDEKDLIKPVAKDYESGGFPVRWAQHPQVDDPDPVYVGTEPPKSLNPMRPGGSERDHSIQVWQRYASPVWFDLNTKETLNVRNARDPDAAKHICPTPLDLYRRLLHLYTIPGDLCIEPYSGLGSGGKVALEMGRKWLAVELNRVYFDDSIKTFTAASIPQMTLAMG